MLPTTILSRMNLRQLRYFAKVIEVGNMTRAASELHVAQPALGMQIRQLEEDLGVALLVRHSRGVDATPAGAVMHRRALAILSLVEDARREVIATGGSESESVRLGLTPALTFGPNRRIGAMGAYIVSVDLKEKKFVAASGWIGIN